MPGYSLWTDGKVCIKVSAGINAIKLLPISCKSGYVLSYENSNVFSNGVSC